MQSRWKTPTRVFMGLVFGCVAGCSNSAVPTPAEQAQRDPTGAATVPAAAATAELKLTVYANLDDPNMQTYANPDSATIEKHVRAMNWQNPQQRPYVHLSRVDASGGSYVKLQGTQGTPNTDGLFRAVGYGIAGPNWAGESPPLESVDAGLELLIMFLNDPQKLMALAAGWTVDNQPQ